MSDWMSQSESKDLCIILHFFRFVQIFPEVFRYIQIYSDIFGYFVIFPHIFRFIEILLDLSGYIYLCWHKTRVKGNFIQWVTLYKQRLMSNDLLIWNFSNLSGYIQIFPDLFRLFQIYSDILQFIQINSDKLQFAANLYICLSFWSLPLSLSLPQCLANNWIWLNKMQLCNLNILLFFWIYSDLSRIIQIFSDQFGFIQICPDLFRLIQIYSD